MYAWMLEEFGYKLHKMFANHVIFKSRRTGEVDRVERIEMEYLKDEVITMLEYAKHSGMI